MNIHQPDIGSQKSGGGKYTWKDLNALSHSPTTGVGGGVNEVNVKQLEHQEHEKEQQECDEREMFDNAAMTEAEEDDGCV